MRMRSQWPDNPFRGLTNEELARACNRYIDLIEKRSQRTKTGDEIRSLLIECGNRLWWQRPGYQQSGNEEKK